MSAESPEDMHDWIEVLLNFEAVLYDPKLHGYRAVVVDCVSQTIPLQPASPITTARSLGKNVIKILN
jgi:hypothetical protein